jgi:hypothetical protein
MFLPASFFTLKYFKHIDNYMFFIYLCLTLFYSQRKVVLSIEIL